MGFLDFLKPKPTIPTVPSILPDAAKLQISRGQLPMIQPNNLFLKNSEICCYVDRAIYEKKIVNKRRRHRNRGYSLPGLFGGTRVHVGGGDTEYVDEVKYSPIKGILYITNHRIIFVSSGDGFDRKKADLVAVTPYSNCVELQFSKETLRLFVPDGDLLYTVLRLA